MYVDGIGAIEMFAPENDGIDHINVYSQARTELGRFLSNFAHCPQNTPDGVFQSLEGYWYWLKTYDDRLRNLYGLDAKNLGRKLPIVNRFDVPRFKKALKIKLLNNKDFLINSPLWCDLELPLTHYYVYNGQRKDAGGQWVIEYLEQLRFDIG